MVDATGGTVSESVGTVAALWRFPVKSFLGERVAEADVTSGGIAGDRGHALIDTSTGKVVSAKNPRLWPDLFTCRAEYVEEPPPGGQLPPVRMTLGDGTIVLSDAGDVDAVLSRFFGREVTLAQSAPADFTIDQYHPDIEGADPEGRRDTVVDQKLGSALFEQEGIPSPVEVGAFFDVFPMSLLTTSTLDRFNELKPDTRFDQRRFRMNVIVATSEPGFVENAWVGRSLAIGADARVMVVMPDPRCVMPTLAQEDLPRDNEVMRTLVRHNRLDAGGAMSPCAGVYAAVTSAGALCAGAEVRMV
jgi:uncharacterized protein